MDLNYISHIFHFFSILMFDICYTKETRKNERIKKKNQVKFNNQSIDEIKEN